MMLEGCRSGALQCSPPCFPFLLHVIVVTWTVPLLHSPSQHLLGCPRSFFYSNLTFSHLQPPSHEALFISLITLLNFNSTEQLASCANPQALRLQLGKTILQLARAPLLLPNSEHNPRHLEKKKTFHLWPPPVDDSTRAVPLLHSFGRPRVTSGRQLPTWPRAVCFASRAAAF